jgi:hypothetical protein
VGRALPGHHFSNFGGFPESGRKRIYVAGGEGFLSVVQQVDADPYSDMGKFPTALGTRTGVWYEKRDRLYIAAPPSGTLGAACWYLRRRPNEAPTRSIQSDQSGQMNAHAGD